MKLAEALAAVGAPRFGTRCGVALFVERLDKAEQAECKAALENLDIPTTTLTDAMNTAYDGKLRKATVGRHRRGDCKCA
jgi:hypothetical protein